MLTHNTRINGQTAVHCSFAYFNGVRNIGFIVLSNLWVGHDETMAIPLPNTFEWSNKGAIFFCCFSRVFLLQEDRMKSVESGLKVFGQLPLSPAPSLPFPVSAASSASLLINLNRSLVNRRGVSLGAVDSGGLRVEPLKSGTPFCERTYFIFSYHAMVNYYLFWELTLPHAFLRLN